MSKNFEDRMMGIIKHSVEICFDNVKDVEEVEKVFIMLWKEKSVSSSMFSYQISGKLVKKHKVSDYATKMMPSTIDDLLTNLNKLEELFIESEREFPTVFKILYYPKTSKLRQSMEYELITKKTGEAISRYFDSWVSDNIS